MTRGVACLPCAAGPTRTRPTRVPLPPHGLHQALVRQVPQHRLAPRLVLQEPLAGQQHLQTRVAALAASRTATCCQGLPLSGLLCRTSSQAAFKMPRARATAGCSRAQGSAMRALPSSWPLYSANQDATEDRCSSLSARAAGSHTQQCTPRRPEYTHKMCWKPNSARSPTSMICGSSQYA
jgi:hypothetical protein